MMRNPALAAAAVALAFGGTEMGHGASAFVPSRPLTVPEASIKQNEPNNRRLRKSAPFLAPAFDFLQQRLSSTKVDMSTVVETASATDFPVKDQNGVYQIGNKEQHSAFLAANPDKLVVMKFYAPWCRACKGLAPKFLQVVNDEKYSGIPILWAELSVLHNKDFVKSLGVLALPSIHFYAGANGLIENFPCGPSKVPILKRKLVQFINDWVHPETMMVKQPNLLLDIDCDDDSLKETEPCRERDVRLQGGDTAPITKISVGDLDLNKDQITSLRTKVSYFKDFTDEEFFELMNHSKLVSFDPGSIIMRQGMEGRTFFVIESGEVEISVKSAFEDPLSPSYLGAVINRLGPNDYFGERSLIMGAPRAATIRAVEKTRCFTFDIDDIPKSSILSGNGLATESRMSEVDDKYGVLPSFSELSSIDIQLAGAVEASQNRGSVNTPGLIKGVDTDDDIEVEEVEEIPEFSSPPLLSNVLGDDSTIISLLVRFKLIRQAARCFEYIMQTQPNWGDKAEAKRRSMLVARLTPAQKEEFSDVFHLIDKDNNGRISLFELKSVLESVGEEPTDDQIRDMINKADPSVDGNSDISQAEFMGVMAEAEFYYLFNETFNLLDKNQTGFVMADELNKVLCGMRDLVSDDRKSIIDVEDDDMLIDYEHFSKMLLGADV